MSLDGDREIDEEQAVVRFDGTQTRYTNVHIDGLHTAIRCH